MAIAKCSTCLNDAATSDWIFEECLPVPAFGEITSGTVRVATVGLNPSSTEFYSRGELKLPGQRLPALADYGAVSRSQLTAENVCHANRRRSAYFNPETRCAHPWFLR